HSPAVAELVLMAFPIIVVLDRTGQVPACLADRLADRLWQLFGKLKTPIGQRDFYPLLAVTREDQAVPALVGMDAPTPVGGLVVLGFQDDGQVLLNLALNHPEPPELNLAGGELEQLALVADGDVSSLSGIRIDCRTLTFPQIPLRCDPLIVEHDGVLPARLPVSAR